MLVWEGIRLCTKSLSPLLRQRDNKYEMTHGPGLHPQGSKGETGLQTSATPATEATHGYARPPK